MKIPAKYSNLLFGGLLPIIMVTIISGAVVLVVAPRVRKLVARLTEPAA
jgi:hypothetical protein